MRRTCVLAGTIGLIAFTVGCGGSSNSQPKAVSVAITAPADGASIRASRVTVRGTVSPPDASVRVLGQPAQVSNGAFSASVPLSAGDNRVDVTATAPGVDAANTAITITRRRAPKKATSTAATGTSTSNTKGDHDCGQGITASGATSCAFAIRVRDSYAAYAEPVIDVYSPVTQQSYEMNCSPSGGTEVTCTGGNGARVMF